MAKVIQKLSACKPQNTLLHKLPAIWVSIHAHTHTLLSLSTIKSLQLHCLPLSLPLLHASSPPSHILLSASPSWSCRAEIPLTSPCSGALQGFHLSAQQQVAHWQKREGGNAIWCRKGRKERREPVHVHIIIHLRWNFLLTMMYFNL